MYRETHRVTVMCLFFSHVGSRIILSNTSQEEGLCLPKITDSIFIEVNTMTTLGYLDLDVAPSASYSLDTTSPPLAWHQQDRRKTLTREGRASRGTCPRQVENPAAPGSLPSTFCHIQFITQRRMGLETAVSMDLEPGHPES